MYTQSRADEEFIGEYVAMNPTFSIWKDKIVLRVRFGDLYGTSLEYKAKWNDKFNAYLMPFGSQNLIRIYENFGKIPVTQGQYRIDGLKQKHESVKENSRLLRDILNGLYDDYKLDYKLPPLALYQHRATVFLTLSKLVPLFADCGMGKTFAVLVSTYEQIKRGLIPPGKVLIAGKLATLYSGWFEDCEKFTNLKPCVLYEKSSYKRKEKILKKLESDADLYIINHEGVRVFKDALKERGFKKVVVDESTILKSFQGIHARKGVFGKALMEVSENATHRVIMSGTPAPNGAYDLWGQFNFLDPEGLLLEPCFYNFRDEYMIEQHFGNPNDDNTPKTWYMDEEDAEKVGNLIRPHSFRVKIRDHLHELPEKTILKRSIMMSPEQTSMYDDLKKGLVELINDDKITASNKLTEIIKLRQTTGGFVISDQENYIQFKDNPKMEELDSLVRDEIDASEKIVIFAQYQWEITEIENRYKDYGAVSVYGGNNSKTNLENIDTFRRDPKCRIIVLHPRSAAHGITLTMAHYLIFYSISYSAEEDYQSVKRIERAGQKNAMMIFYLLSKHPRMEFIDVDLFGENHKEKFLLTIDEIIYYVLQRKIKSQAHLLDGDVQGDIEKDIVNLWSKYG